MSNILIRPRLALWLFVFLTSIAMADMAFAKSDSTSTDSSAVKLMQQAPAAMLYQSNSMRAKVSSMDESSKRVNALFTQYGVEIIREETNKADQLRETIWTVRLHKDKLEEFAKTLESKTALILSEGTNLEEKSPLLVELDQRIAFKKETLDEISALAKKTSKPSELIEARVAIRNLEEELQQMIEARAKMVDESNLVTMTITFVEDATVAAPAPTFTEQLYAAFFAGIDNLKGTLLLIVTYWPITLAALVALIYFWLAINHNRQVAKRQRKQREFEQELKRTSGPMI